MATCEYTPGKSKVRNACDKGGGWVKIEAMADRECCFSAASRGSHDTDGIAVAMTCQVGGAFLGSPLPDVNRQP